MLAKSNELLFRLGKLFFVVVLLCVVFVITYFLVLLSTGEFSRFLLLNKPQVEDYSKTVSILARVYSVKDDLLVLLEDGTGKSYSLELTDQSKIEKYNLLNRSVDYLQLSSLTPGEYVMVEFDQYSKLVENISILPVTISGRVLRNVAGVITIESMSKENAIRTDTNTLVTRQDGFGSVESDLTIVDVAVDDKVLVTLHDFDEKLAAEVSILPVFMEGSK